MMDKFYTMRILMVVLGNVIIGMGVSLFRVIGFGVDPFTSMNIGLSKTIGMSLGLFQVIVNIIILSLILFITKDKKIIGIGTIVNMVFLGYIIEFLGEFYNIFFDDPRSLWVKVILMILSFILVSLGVSTYCSAKLGSSPYDYLPNILNKYGEYGTCRVILDILCVVIGVVCKSELGISTVLIALGTGPVVQRMNVYIENRLFNSSNIYGYLENLD